LLQIVFDATVARCCATVAQCRFFFLQRSLFSSCCPAFLLLGILSCCCFAGRLFRSERRQPRCGAMPLDSPSCSRALHQHH
jgi:hypothetical protein